SDGSRLTAPGRTPPSARASFSFRTARRRAPHAVGPSASGGPMDAFIEFQRVTKNFGAVTVVDRLDLQIAKGEFLSLLGPSGSGKTTILMMLAGFERPTSGSILLADRPITHLPPHRRQMGVVFQNYALFPHMSVAENVAFP